MNKSTNFSGEIIYQNTSKQPIKVEMPESSFFGVLLEKQAYNTLLYQLVMFILSILFFVYTVTMFSLSLGLAITIFGLPVTYVFLKSIPEISIFQSYVASSLLGTPLPRRDPMVLRGSFWENLRMMATSKKNLLGIVFNIFFFPFIVLSFVLVIVGFAVSLSFIAVLLFPLVRSILGANGIDASYDAWIIDNIIPEWIILSFVSILGLLFLAVTLHFSKFVSYYHASLNIYLAEIQ